MIEELKKLEEYKQTKQSFEKMKDLRRKRHEDTIKDLKAEAEQKARIDGRPSPARDAYINELTAEFEAGLQEEFKNKLEAVYEEKGIKEAVIKIQKEIENKDKEIDAQKKKIDAKDLELAQAKSEIMRIYRQSEGEIFTPVDTSHIDKINTELSELRNELNTLETQRDELKVAIEEFEPQIKYEEKTVQEEVVKEEPVNKEPVEEQKEPGKEAEDVLKKFEELVADELVEIPEVEIPEVEIIEAEIPAVEEATQKELVEDIHSNSNKEDKEQGNEDEQIDKTNLELSKIEIIIDGIEGESSINIKRREPGISAPKRTYENATELVDRAGFNKDIEGGDPYVIREIENAHKNGYLTQEEAVEQIDLYLEILKDPEDQHKIEKLKEKLKIDLKYDLRGLKYSGLTKEQRLELEGHAKEAKDAEIAEVEAPWYTKAKWKIQEFVKKHEWAQKISEGVKKIGNKTVALLTKGKGAEKKEEIEENEQTEAPAKKEPVVPIVEVDTREVLEKASQENEEQENETEEQVPEGEEH